MLYRGAEHLAAERMQINRSAQVLPADCWLSSVQSSMHTMTESKTQ